MNQHKYERIDKGIKRPRVKRSQVETDARKFARTQLGRYVSLYTPEQRQNALTEAIQGLEIGIPPKDIATKHGIPCSTLYAWLLANDVAPESRSRFFHCQISQQLEAMEVAASPLELARARDLRRAWAETAAVRDHVNYGPYTHVTVEHVGDLADKLRRARERTPLDIVDADVVPSQQPAQIGLITQDDDAK